MTILFHTMAVVYEDINFVTNNDNAVLVFRQLTKVKRLVTTTTIVTRARRSARRRQAPVSKHPPPFWINLVDFCFVIPREAKEYSFELVGLSVRPSVRPSVCPSVRPSVRPSRSFFDFVRL